ncbi:hypothetical protein Leryth_011723 [Lithospermum erythrorhizon]|nr:hypothetical protein Leryth_011723 [Lithospermum erythrorhizon]
MASSLTSLTSISSDFSSHHRSNILLINHHLILYDVNCERTQDYPVQLLLQYLSFILKFLACHDKVPSEVSNNPVAMRVSSGKHSSTQ